VGVKGGARGIRDEKLGGFDEGDRGVVEKDFEERGFATR